MKLRNIIYGMSALAVGLAFTACSDIDEADRLIYVKPAEVSKRVLIEDFTGQRCVNCPLAATVIEQLQEQYGADNVIAVGLYSGPYGKTPQGKPYPLTTDQGNAYYDFWGVKEQPSGMIDRHGVTSNYNGWPMLVYNALQQSATLMLEMENEYDEASRTVKINVKSEGVENTTGQLQVWLIEDNIQGVQFMPDGSVNREYTHNHVFRATVNGESGDAISLLQGEVKNNEFTATLAEDWKAEDMSVVAFVYNDSGVLQAVKASVIKQTDEGQQPEEGENK